MNLTDINTIKSILDRHGFKFSKSLGQNFLINPSVCPRMADSCGASDQTGVIEVGPGIGVLTCELAKRAKKVVSIELDSRLLPILKETLSEYENIDVINDDILKADLKKIIDERFSGMNVSVCANLPYYITSPVIMHLLESRLPITSLTVMVQKEAAKRLCAVPGSKDCGAVSYAVSYYSNPKILFDVSSGSFMPRPKVDSCVINLEIRKDPPIEIKNEKLFFKIIHASFQQRRKTILNAVSSGIGMNKDELTEALNQAGIGVNERGEKLNLEQFARLSDAVFALKQR